MKLEQAVKLVNSTLKSMDNGEFNFTDNGKCCGCGNCCSNYLMLTDKEIDLIRDYIKLYNIKEQKHNAPFANHKQNNDTCPFLIANKSTERCSIYLVRPQICKMFNCDKSQRPKVSPTLSRQSHFVNMRETFFSKKEGD